MNREIEEIKNCLCDVLEFDYSDESGVTKVDAKTTAEGLYNSGYRKASDVAREIFEEIETLLNLSKCYGDSGIYFERDIETDIAKLKKKYKVEKRWINI